MCAANKIPGSYAKSNLVTTGGVGGSNTVSCDGTDKIVTGVKYAMVVITVLCAPSKYGEALVQYGVPQDKTVCESATQQTLDCDDETEDAVSTNTGTNYGPRNTLLMGDILVLAHDYTQDAKDIALK